MPFEDNANVIKECNISDAWRSLIWATIRNGDKYIVKTGSFAGEIRKQLDHCLVIIEKPWTRPLEVFTPENMSYTPATKESIEEYFCNYILNEQISENEDYTYGLKISKQINRVIDLLFVSRGATNQAVIEIANENSCYLENPECLRLIDFKITDDDRLDMHLYLRSWDIMNGFPVNIGGLQLLKEYVAWRLEELGIKVRDGKIHAYSSGAHIYEHMFEIANTLCVDKIK